MPVSQAAREALLVAVRLFQGDMANIDPTTLTAASGGKPYKVLEDCTIKRLSLDFATLTGSSQFTVTIKKNGTAVCTIATATPGVAGTPTTADVDVDLDKDDLLTFFANGTDANTDDATDVEIHGLLQILRDQSDA